MGSLLGQVQSRRLGIVSIEIGEDRDGSSSAHGQLGVLANHLQRKVSEANKEGVVCMTCTIPIHGDRCMRGKSVHVRSIELERIVLLAHAIFKKGRFARIMEIASWTAPRKQVTEEECMSLE